ncbi:MAG: hypothetical protein ACW981_01790 [Candidatus Hodarchaeales archaeon]|jgi:hypothetical protein
MVSIPSNLSILSKKSSKTILHVGEVVLGIPKEELGQDFILEIDHYLSGLPKFFFRDIKILFFLFNSRLMSVVMMRKLKKFTNMKRADKEKFLDKWANSRLSVIRMGFLSLKSMCGWAFYSQEDKVKTQIPDYPGRTLNREHETPTLLFGKEPWDSSPEKLNEKYIVSFERGEK